MIDIESKKRKLQLLVAIGLAFVLIVAMPLLVMLFKSLVLTIFIGLTGLAAVNFAPVLGMKFANWKMKAIKAEAAANPIETLENEYLEQSKNLDEQKKAIEKWQASLELYIGKVKTLVQKYPHRREEYEQQVAGRVALLDLRWQGWQELRDNLKLFREKIDEDIAVNDAALAMLAVDNLTPTAQQKALSQIKINSATDAVRLNVANSSARLTSSLRELEYDDSKKLELGANSLAKARELLA